jgi:hypothetical protein
MARKLIKDKRGNVLAEGEHTGHYHAASTRGSKLYEDEAYGGLVLVVEDETSLTHQEHDTQIITKEEVGEHYVGGIVEYDPFKEEMRKVVD